MYGLLEKMDRFSNNRMNTQEQISFVQELIDIQMIWTMHQKYQDTARCMLGLGLVKPKTEEDKIKVL